MGMPSKLKNFNVAYDGNNHIGLCAEVSLTKLARKLESYRGAGMNGEVKVDLGMEGLEIEHTYGGFMRDIFRTFGIAKIDGVALRFSGAYQRDDTEEVDAVEVYVRGRHEEIDPGSAKGGDDTEMKIKSNLTYYKLVVNGVTEVEIDLLNFIEIVGGVDRLAEQRAALNM